MALFGIGLAIFGAIQGWQQAQDAKEEAILAQTIADSSAVAAREAARAAQNGETAASNARDAARAGLDASASANGAALAAVIAAEESRKLADMVAKLLVGGRFERPSFLTAPLLSGLTDLVICDGANCRVPRGTIAIAKDAEKAAKEAQTLVSALPLAPVQFAR